MKTSDDDTPERFQFDPLKIDLSKIPPPDNRYADGSHGFCSKCKTIKPAAEMVVRMTNKKARAKTCKACHAVYARDHYRNKTPAKENPLAFTHVIADRYTGRLYKYSLLQGELPSGYTIIHVGMAGFLLPVRYKDLEAYDAGEADTKQSNKKHGRRRSARPRDERGDAMGQA